MEMLCDSETARANLIAQPPPPPRIATRYGVDYCLICDLPVTYCRGHGLSDASAAQDGRAAASLDKRIREAQTHTATAAPPPGWVLFCGSCGRPIRGAACACRS